MTVVTILSVPPRPSLLWNLAVLLLESPFYLPASWVFYDLPGLLPFPWSVTSVTPEGIQVARIPHTMPLFLPVGTVLSALQAWLYYSLTRRADVGGRAAARIARLRASFQTKLLVGFLLLSIIIFATGWLAWAQTEAMHFLVHQGRATQHWLDHALSLRRNLTAQTEALSRLAEAGDEATSQEVSSLGKKVADELIHLKRSPPPAHPATSTGMIGQVLRDEAEKRLPSVHDLDSRFSELDAAVGRALATYRSDAVPDAEAQRGLAALQRSTEARLLELVDDLNADQVAWVANVDTMSHVELYYTMLLVLLATGVAFPLGWTFAQVVVRPVNNVGQGLERIGAGDFASRVQVENQDELGDLAQRVNQMSGELHRLYAELRGLNENLQQKVQEQLQEIERAQALKRYLSPQVADSIIEGRSDVKLATTRKNLTVCFSDIRGFTGMSERLEPEELIDLLNAYFTAMTEIIFQHGGTLDKYLGDGILVFFGDPVPYEDHEARAGSMALDMRLKLAEFQRQWFVDRQETLNIGIGISTGYVTVGNIGSAARLEYTVIGNNGNLASRLGDMATPGQILITERTLVRVRDLVQAREVGEVTVEGSARPVRIYEVLDRMSDDIFALRRPL